MTVKELIEKLQKMPQDAVVLCGTDKEFWTFAADVEMGEKPDEVLVRAEEC